MWRGEWRKNDSQYWHFVPEQTDSGLTLYLEEGEGYTSVEMIVRKHYGIGASTPMVITYGLPDWMVFPSGHTPPLTIGNSTELVELMASRPWMVEFTLFVTLGAKGVAEYYFNRRSPFYIGSSFFVVDHTQDAFARASYESSAMLLQSMPPSSPYHILTVMIRSIQWSCLSSIPWNSHGTSQTASTFEAVLAFGSGVCPSPYSSDHLRVFPGHRGSLRCVHP
ncbi:hypothetical protein Bca52824_019899 [Brassica carinata]|uniref:Uncharacterized protein n=1 Tax=Brassica carinata TaxID=52824 RepID=A0A8X8B004_BRACI|nr:hypothetical protein Bca52824_019899 [Brassica carinata]